MKIHRTIGFIVLLGALLVTGLSISDSNQNRRAEAELLLVNTMPAENVGEIDMPPLLASPSVTPPNSESKSNSNNSGKSQPSRNPVSSAAKPNIPAHSTFMIDVNVSEQIVRIYENGKLAKEWIVSTGKNDATPLGRFEIQNRGKWFFSEKYQQGAKWWVSFKYWGTYLFHSVPMDESKHIIAEEADKLGTPASHGCVRLTVENAKWIYDNIPQGTEVYIHK